MPAPFIGHCMTHVPALQQPPLHVTTPPHAAVQLPELHARPMGQSVDTMQPHEPPAPRFPRQACPFDDLLQSPGALHPHLPLLHAWPAAAFVQSTHVCPEAPHVVVWPSAPHDPFEQQKPVPHVPSVG